MRINTRIFQFTKPFVSLRTYVKVKYIRFHVKYRFLIIVLKLISSIRVQDKVGSRDEMRWSPYIVGQWVARVPADHADAPSQGLMKWSEMDEMSVEKWWNEICGRGKREKPREKPTQTPFRQTTKPKWRVLFLIIILLSEN